MAKVKVCPQHGRDERRQCPACAWCSDYPEHVKFQSGCPMCGAQLDDNTGLIMACAESGCPMMTTSHPPPPRRQVKPSDVGLRGSRL